MFLTGMKSLVAFLLLGVSTNFMFAREFHVYFGTYTGAKSKGIYVSKFDSETGKLSAPELAAETVLKIIASSSPHLRYVIGQQAKSATLLRQLLPEAIFGPVVRNFFSLDKNN